MMHSPQPWRVRRVHDNHYHRFTIVAADDKNIGTDWRARHGLDDAKLVAAAPEMRDALLDALRYLNASDDGAWFACEDLRLKIKAALTKAGDRK